MSLPEIDFDSLSPGERAAVERLLGLKAADPRIRVRHRVAREMLDCAEWAMGQIEDRGEVETILVNGQKWTLTGSIYDKLINDVLTPTPAVAREAPKKPVARLPRTQAQLDALARKNAQRRSEALARREESADA